MRHLKHTPGRLGLGAASTSSRRLRVRMYQGFRCLALALVCASAMSTLPALAYRSAQFWVQASALSLEEAADRVQGAYGGRVVAAQPARAHGRDGFRIRVLLDDGRVITVFVDADSGAMRPVG